MSTYLGKTKFVWNSMMPFTNVENNGKQTNIIRSCEQQNAVDGKGVIF